MKVTGGSNKRVSLAALIAIKPGHAPRLIYRVHKKPRRGSDKRKGFTETGYAPLFDAPHQQLAGPLVVVWDNSNTHTSAAMTKLAAARDWLTIFQLPPYAHELNPVEMSFLSACCVGLLAHDDRAPCPSELSLRVSVSVQRRRLW